MDATVTPFHDKTNEDVADALRQAFESTWWSPSST
jgi:hypothetical protein